MAMDKDSDSDKYFYGFTFCTRCGNHIHGIESHRQASGCFLAHSLHPIKGQPLRTKHLHGDNKIILIKKKNSEKLIKLCSYAQQEGRGKENSIAIQPKLVLHYIPEISWEPNKLNIFNVGFYEIIEHLKGENDFMFGLGFIIN